MAAGLCSVAFIGLVQMHHINSILETITKERVQNLVRSHKIMSQFYIQIINERNYVLQEKAEARVIQKERIDKRHIEMNEMIETRKKYSSPEGLKDLLEFKDLYIKWTEFNNKIQELVESGRAKEASAMISESGRKLRTDGEAILQRMNERDTKRMDDETATAGKAYTDAKYMVVIASTLALLIGLGLAIVVLRAVSSTIDKVISSLSENSEQVTTASGQIASAAQELSQAVTEQASSLEETASSIEEMSSMVQKNADNAKEATSLAEGSKASANRGQKVVDSMITTIDDISTSNQNIMEQINHSNKQISEIVNVIREIESKTKVINDIVFQTKLLSFNASVEAARAGEQGKGFAVVAEEVGSLAAMSGNAANEISILLDSSIQKVETIVRNTQTKVEVLIKEGTIKVELGTRIARECGEVLEEIVLSTAKVTKMTEEISVACQEQSMGVQEITRAMHQLDQITQMNATSSEETASSAEELSGQAVSLKNVVGLLMTTIKGGNGPVEMVHVARSNVVPMTKASVKKPHVPKPVSVSRSSHTPAPSNYKKAVGESFQVPKGDDSRFEEV